MATQPHFLWPKHSREYLRFIIGKGINASIVELRLKKLFPDVVPVLFSSARSGLSAVLYSLGLGRSDIVWCPPYSSHCVLETIARIASPSTTDCSSAKVALVYHQWGFLHQHTSIKNAVIIEDAVDTFFMPNTNPFGIDGRFVLWSLPKVISTTFGGVVFCRSEEDAKILREIRYGRSYGKNLQALLRIGSDYSKIAENYWHGVESMSGALPDFALRQIYDLLMKYKFIGDYRQSLYSFLDSKGIGVQIDNGRLPSNIPIHLNDLTESYWGGACFSAGYRFMNIAKNYSFNDWRKVAPLPINQDIKLSELKLLPLNKLGVEY